MQKQFDWQAFPYHARNLQYLEAAVGSQRIVASIKDVENLSRDAAAESQNVSAATEEQSASMEQIAASSQALAKLAQELQLAVAKFKI